MSHCIGTLSYSSVVLNDWNIRKLETFEK
jgi:hypothetical protein